MSRPGRQPCEIVEPERLFEVLEAVIPEHLLLAILELYAELGVRALADQAAQRRKQHGVFARIRSAAGVTSSSSDSPARSGVRGAPDDAAREQPITAAPVAPAVRTAMKERRSLCIADLLVSRTWIVASTAAVRAA